MNALTQHHIRKAALDVKAHNPLADVFVPEEPDWQDVLNAQAYLLLRDCAEQDQCESIVNDFEILLEQRAELVRRTADAWAAIRRRWPDAVARRDELAALGADLLRLVMADLRKVAEFELEREK